MHLRHLPNKMPSLEGSFFQNSYAALKWFLHHVCVAIVGNSDNAGSRFRNVTQSIQTPYDMGIGRDFIYPCTRPAG